MIKGRTAAAFSAVLTLGLTAGCSATPALGPPEGNGVCVDVAATLPEPVWFGIPVWNETGQTIVLEQVRLGDGDGLELTDAVAIPPIPTPDGGTNSLGSARNPARDMPDLWAVRQPLAGYRLEPGEVSRVVVGLSRLPGAEVGVSTSQLISYRLGRERHARLATSRLELVLAPDC